MGKYYFTFGSSGQIYNGGWVEIEAAGMGEAQQKFIKRFGADAKNEDGLLRYCSGYTQEEFEVTSMYRSDNFGSRCHEVIK